MRQRPTDELPLEIRLKINGLVLEVDCSLTRASMLLAGHRRDNDVVMLVFPMVALDHRALADQRKVPTRPCLPYLIKPRRKHPRCSSKLTDSVHAVS